MFLWARGEIACLYDEFAVDLEGGGATVYGRGMGWRVCMMSLPSISKEVAQPFMGEGVAIVSI